MINPNAIDEILAMTDELVTGPGYLPLVDKLREVQRQWAADLEAAEQYHSQLFALENALEAQTNIIRRNREQMERVYRMRTA